MNQPYYSYFIPINSINLVHYFSSGLIKPSGVYLKRTRDCQDLYKNYILLSNKIWFKESNCSLEIVLSEEENKMLTNIDKEFYLFNNPLPISRVKSVLFPSKKEAETMLWNINDGAAFIPDDLVKIKEYKDTDIAYMISNKEKIDTNNSGIEDKVRYFDKVLGGFAFMKLGGVSRNIEYPKNYFKALGNFNVLFSDIIDDYTRKVSNHSFGNIYAGLFSKNDVKWGKLQEHLSSDPRIEDVKKIAEREGIELKIKVGKIDVDSISKDSFIYDLIIIATYGENKNKSIDDLINELDRGKYDKKKEELTLVFGLHNGYTKFRNTCKIDGVYHNIKFKLDSKLDYYTIESIYQKIFNKKKEELKFPYLDDWIPQAQFVEYGNEYETYKVLDKNIIYKKKHSVRSKEYLQELFDSFATKDIYNKLYEDTKIWFPSFISIDKDKLTREYSNVLEGLLQEKLQSMVKKVISDSEKEILFRTTKPSKGITISKAVKNTTNKNKLVPESTQTLTDNATSAVILENDRRIKYSQLTVLKLKGIAKGLGVKLPKRTKKDVLISLIIGKENSLSKLSK